jgi:hypothetical protein
MMEIERSHREARIVLGALAIMAMGLVLRNGWAQDDVDLILTNGAVQHLSGLWTGFVSPWWPPPWELGLYRPLARTLLTGEWLLFGGRVWGIHLTSLILYTLTVLGVWSLAADLLPSGVAWIAAALFAIHPVHVEAVALGVNQGELVVALLTTLAIRRFLAVRAGSLEARRGWAGIAGLTVAALLFKEHAVVIPLLLLAADLTLPIAGEGRPLRSRVGGYLTLALIVALFWSARAAVLGTFAGAPPAEGLSPDLLPRALTMLGVVPTWARLLLFPAHLQADYAPMEIVPWAGWTSAQTMGVLLLLAWVALFVWGRRRAPAVAFAALFLAIALLPVSNILIPTGILAAERVLFLPSIGIVLLVAAASSAILPVRSAGPLRLAQVTAVALLLGLGMIRCAMRLPVWHDQGSHIVAQFNDAPASYRAYVAAGTLRYEVFKDRRGGETLLRTAIAIWPSDPWPYAELADRYRQDGLCTPAEKLYQEAMLQAPEWSPLRLGALACLFHEGRWSEAATLARAPEILPADRARFERAAASADSAAKRGAAAGSVPFPLLPDGYTSVGPRRGW